MGPPLCQIAHIIKDIPTFLEGLSSWKIRIIFREANRAPDWIANVDHLVDSQFFIQDCNHSTLHNILVTNKVGATLVRGNLLTFFLLSFKKIM